MYRINEWEGGWELEVEIQVQTACDRFRRREPSFRAHSGAILSSMGCCESYNKVNKKNLAKKVEKTTKRDHVS